MFMEGTEKEPGHRNRLFGGYWLTY